MDSWLWLDTLCAVASNSLQQQVAEGEAVASPYADSMQHSQSGSPSVVQSSLPCPQQAIQNGVCCIVDALQSSCCLLQTGACARFSFNQLDHSGLLRSSIACADAVASSQKLASNANSLIRLDVACALLHELDYSCRAQMPDQFEPAAPFVSYRHPSLLLTYHGTRTRHVPYTV